MSFRITPKIMNRLVDHIEDIATIVRSYEKKILNLCIDRAKLDRKKFVELYRANNPSDLIDLFS